MLDEVNVLYHSSIKIMMEKVIYVDPYKINGSYKDADIIFITHDHYDHFSEEDINKIKKENTNIIVPKNMLDKVKQLGFKEESIIEVEPNQKYIVSNIKFETVPAYNINKEFHPKANGWVGYIIQLNKKRYYIAGDTDFNEDNEKVKCDIAFVPVGGTFTMNYEEAAELINTIQPKIAIPIHYGSIVGTIEDAKLFIKSLNKNIKGEILMK